MMSSSNSIVVMEKPAENFSIVQIKSFPEKEKAKNTKQITWVLLLKSMKIIGCLSWLATGFWSMLGRIKKRVMNFKRREESHKMGRLLRFLRALLVISVVLLVLEVVAYIKGWNLNNLIQPLQTEGFLHLCYLAWLSLRADYIAPAVVMLSKLCAYLFVIQSLDRIILCFMCFWIKYKKIKPRIAGKGYVTVDDFPMVLVQIPMCNEREVYAQSISAVCQLDWPRDRFLVQILDDSDDNDTQNLIRNEVSSWRQEGVNIVYMHRLVRTGYKAGNLKSGMACDYVKDYQYVTIFDADFQPNPDFLKLTVPHFKGNPELGLVQARWSFINKDENLLTRLQNINLCFHFEVEQQVNGNLLNFFGFNGTAGVWRIKALEESGGWMDRTTVEDMDIAVRAHLNGWKFIFLNDVNVLCELPESYEAYKKQQHRWHSGPMQLFRLCFSSIITSKISVSKKANLIFLFFLLRKLILPFYSFTLFCIILPLTMFIPEAELPTWLICYIPIFMTILNILPAPKSFPFLIPYLLFENTMSVTKFSAMVSGLLKLGSAYEWVVTKKTGRSLSQSDLLDDEELQQQSQDSESGVVVLEEKAVLLVKKKNKIYQKELALAFLLLTASARSILSAQGIHFYFLLFQGLSFLIIGLDLIGEQKK